MVKVLQLHMFLDEYEEFLVDELVFADEMDEVEMVVLDLDDEVDELLDLNELVENDQMEVQMMRRHKLEF